MNTRPSPPMTARAVAAHLEGVLTASSHAHAYYDEGEDFVVAVAEVMNQPAEGLATFSTVSLHSSENRLDNDDIRVELLLVCFSDLRLVPNVLATSAFNVMKDRWLAAPGVVFPDVVAAYYPATTTPHVMWSPPFDFPELSTVDVSAMPQNVHWLQAVPLTDSEREFLMRHGFEALSERMERADALHYDFNRKSVC